MIFSLACTIIIPQPSPWHFNMNQRQHYAPGTLLAKYKLPQPSARRLSHFATIWLSLFLSAFPSLFLSAKYYYIHSLRWIYLSIYKLSVCVYIYIHIYIHYTNNPVLESGDFGAYLNQARNVWESQNAHLPFLAKAGSCFHEDLLKKRSARLQVVVLSLHYITLH